jgi:ankyrin repeat protein
MKLSISEREFFSSVIAGDVSAVTLALRPEPYLVDFQDEIGKTPLWLAVENGLLEMTQVLIAHGGAKDITDQDGNSLLHFAIDNCLNTYDSLREHCIKIVNLLLSSGIDIDTTNGKGFGGLHKAAIFGDKEMVLFLLGKGADVNLRSIEGLTPFLWTLYANVWERDIPKYLETLDALVQAGADVNVVTYDGKTVLDIAREMNLRPPFIKFLRECGAI